MRSLTCIIVGALLVLLVGVVDAAKPAKPPKAAKGKAAPATKPAAAATAAAAKRERKVAYPSDYRPPLQYGKDFIGVTPDGTLSVRYRVWGDFWGKNLESYLADAKQSAEARAAPPRRVTFAGVFMKNVEIICPNHPGGDGKPLRGTFTISPAQEESMRTEAKKVQDFFFAASNGRLQVDFIFPVVDGLKVESPNKPIFSVWPRGLQDQLLPALAAYKDANVAMWVFLCPRPVTLNPTANGKGIGVGPFGICYTAWPLYGGYCMTTTAAAAGLWVHEFNHRYLDGLKNHEGVQLTRVHSLGMLGYAPGLNLDEGYFNTYLHLIRPAIYDRFSIGAPNQTPLEPFSGKAYAWADVKDDCWFRLPELRNAELAKLTGIESFEIDATKGSTRLFKVADADRAKVLSPYAATAAPTTVPADDDLLKSDRPVAAAQLDNVLVTNRESCAVLKTATGQWLFVSVNMADLYVDMLRMSGRGQAPLEVYGYVNEGTLPLLVIKAPPEAPLPVCEEGYFRTPAKDEGLSPASPTTLR